MRLTSKGQVTVPREVREKLGLKPGSEVDFVVDGDGARLVRLERSKAAARERALRMAERMQRLTPPGGMTTDELMKLMRGDEWPDLR